MAHHRRVALLCVALLARARGLLFWRLSPGDQRRDFHERARLGRSRWKPRGISRFRVLASSPETSTRSAAQLKNILRGAALHTRLHARIRHPVRASARPRVLPAHLPWACRSATVRVLYYRKAMPPVCAHAHTATSEIADAPKLQARAAFYTTSCSRGIGGLRISEVFVPMTESMIP